MEVYVPKLEGKDVFSIVVVICATTMIVCGKDGLVGWSLVGCVFGYYGIDLTPFFKVGRNRKGK